jgi:hypothetical protein
MSESDPIMDALTRSNPVDQSKVPTAQSEAAQALLSEITSRPSGAGFDAYRAPVSHVRTPTNPGRYRFLAAVAVAIAVVAASVSFLLPNNAEPALALVQAAASETQQATSGRVTTTFGLVGSDGVESAQVEAEFEVLFSNGDIAASVTRFSDFTSESDDFDDIEEVEIRLVDDVAYLKEDNRWVGVDAPRFVSDLLIAEFADPTLVLDEVKKLTEVAEVGSETINGVETTHYRSNIDLSDGSTFNATGWLGQLASEASLEADGVVQIDLYVGNDGLLRLLEVTADLEPSDSTIDGAARFTVSTLFSDLNTDIQIDAPEGAEMISMGGLGGFGEEFGN